MAKQLCPRCNTRPAPIHPLYGVVHCENCIRGVAGKKAKGRRALTEYEKLKLSWYKDERKWHENIRQRQIIKDNYGNKVPVLINDKGEITGRMPEPRDRY